MQLAPRGRMLEVVGWRFHIQPSLMPAHQKRTQLDAAGTQKKDRSRTRPLPGKPNKETERVKNTRDKGTKRSRQKTLFAEYMKVLKKYREKYGHVMVPINYETNSGKIGRWLANMRQALVYKWIGNSRQQ